MSCRFTSHSTQNMSFWGRSPSQSLGLVWKKQKLNLTQQKHTFTNQTKCTTIQNKHKKLKPGLVAFYNIRPGNGEGLFWFWQFINLSLTYLDTYPLTNSPRIHTGHLNTRKNTLAIAKGSFLRVSLQPGVSGKEGQTNKTGSR